MKRRKKHFRRKFLTPKIVIQVTGGIEPDNALWHVSEVIRHGRISIANKIPHFCFVSKFPSGVEVITKTKRSIDADDSFIVLRDPNPRARSEVALDSGRKE